MEFLIGLLLFLSLVGMFWWLIKREEPERERPQKRGSELPSLVSKMKDYTDEDWIMIFKPFNSAQAAEALDNIKTAQIYLPNKAYAFLMSKIDGRKWVDDEEYKGKESLADELGKLLSLYQSGALTKEEFDAAKEKLLKK